MTASGNGLIQAQEAQPIVAIRSARVIDGTGAKPFEPGAVLIQGERIVAMGGVSIIPVGATLVDLGDATGLPGLIDLPTHLTDKVGLHWEGVLVTTTPSQAALYGAANALTTLRAGVTTTRDMGPTWPYTDVDLRNIINQGTLSGPRIQVAGNYVSSTGGAGDGGRAVAGHSSGSAAVLRRGDRDGGFGSEPSADITELERVRWVMKGGVVYRDELGHRPPS